MSPALPIPSARSVQDNRNAIRALVVDLRKHAEELRSAKLSSRSETLAEFRSFSFGEDDAFYPIAKPDRLWLKHRVPVSHIDLEAAGYEDYWRSWKCSLDTDPWRHVYWGGEVPLWSWSCPKQSEITTRLPRADFLERVAARLESRLLRVYKAHS